MEKKHVHGARIKFKNSVNHIYRQLNNLINITATTPANCFVKNRSFTDVVNRHGRLDREINHIYSKINDLYAEEIQMRISKNKIQHYIDKMSALCAAVMSERKSHVAFDPVDVVNMAISSCSVLNKYPKIKLLVPKKIPKVIGNPIPYLQAITMLLNSIAKMTDKYIYLKLKSCHLEDNKVIFELNVDLINGKKGYDDNFSASFNRQLNYDFFLIRKTLAKINGKLIVDDNHASTISFIVVSTFTKDDEDDFISSDKELTYIYNLAKQTQEVKSKSENQSVDRVMNSAVTTSLPVTLFNPSNNPISNADIFQSTLNKEQSMKGELLFAEIERLKKQNKGDEIKRLILERKNITHRNIQKRNERIKNQIKNEAYQRQAAYKKFK